MGNLCGKESRRDRSPEPRRPGHSRRTHDTAPVPDPQQATRPTLKRKVTKEQISNVLGVDSTAAIDKSTRQEYELRNLPVQSSPPQSQTQYSQGQAEHGHYPASRLPAADPSSPPLRTRKSSPFLGPRHPGLQAEMRYEGGIERTPPLGSGSGSQESIRLARNKGSARDGAEPGDRMSPEPGEWFAHGAAQSIVPGSRGTYGNRPATQDEDADQDRIEPAPLNIEERDEFVEDPVSVLREGYQRRLAARYRELEGTPGRSRTQAPSGGSSTAPETTLRDRPQAGGTIYTDPTRPSTGRSSTTASSDSEGLGGRGAFAHDDSGHHHSGRRRRSHRR